MIGYISLVIITNLNYLYNWTNPIIFFHVSFFNMSMNFIKMSFFGVLLTQPTSKYHLEKPKKISQVINLTKQAL